MPDTNVTVAEEKKTMFSEEERKKVIEDILIETKIKGRRVDSLLNVYAFEAFFGACKLFIQFHRTASLEERSGDAQIVVEEAFGSGELKSGEFQGYCNYGVRKRYEGWVKGLYTVWVSGVEKPRLDGKSGHGSLGYYRSDNADLQSTCNWVKPIQQDDRESFDCFLAYIRRELRDVQTIEIDFTHDLPGYDPFFEITQTGDKKFKLTKSGGNFEEALEKLLEMCSLDTSRSNAENIRRKPVYELEFTRRALERLGMQEKAVVETVVNSYNERLEAEKRKIWADPDMG